MGDEKKLARIYATVMSQCFFLRNSVDRHHYVVWEILR